MPPFSRSAPKPRTVQDFINEPDRNAQTVTEDHAHIELRRRQPRDVQPEAEPSAQQAPRLSFEPPWSKHEKSATAKNVFNLRLNDYYLEMLRHTSERDGEKSMQKIVKEILLPELERRALQ